MGTGKISPIVVLLLLSFFILPNSVQALHYSIFVAYREIVSDISNFPGNYDPDRDEFFFTFLPSVYRMTVRTWGGIGNCDLNVYGDMEGSSEYWSRNVGTDEEITVFYPEEGIWYFWVKPVTAFSGVSFMVEWDVEQYAQFLDEENEDRSVVGAVADGRSRVIVELHGVTSSANVTIPAGDSDGTWVSDPTLLDGVWRRTWQAPESFGGSGYDSTQGKRPISFAIVIDGESISPPSFNLYKAPVVLLHGLWAAYPPVWTGLKAYLKSNGFNVVNDDPYPDDRSFEQNHYVVHAHVDRALAEARQQGLVAKKADVVGHSMGGILAKKYGSSSYIRRVVTIGTPHYGSPWPNWLLANPWLELVLNWYGGKSMNHGAISDLQVRVCNVPGNSLDVPVLAIAGKSSSDTFPGSGGDIFSAIFNLATLGLGTPSKVHTAQFGTNTSDWVVSTPSQGGGLPIEEVSGIWHLEEPKNSKVFEKVAGFLDKTIIGAAGTAKGQSIEPHIEDSSAIALLPSQDHVQLTEEEGGEITITAPLAGSIYSPGDTMHVTLVAPLTTTKVWVATPGSAAVTSEAPPFATDITIPQEAIGQSRIIAVAWGERGFLAMTSTVINVTTPASITALKIWPDSGLYLSAGETVPFVVHGIFSDGIERNITGSEFGTAYTTTDTSVASIDTNGVLTAKVPGSCSVIVSNGDSIQIPVLVRASVVIDDFSGTAEIAKCTVTAGSKANSDAISFSGTMDATADNLSSASSIEVTIDSNDMVNPCVKTFPITGNFKKGKFKCSASNASFALDTKTSKFSFTAKNVSLKGLSCPLTVQIKIGDYIGTTQVGEDIVNGAKPIPISLLMGVKNSLRVDGKPKFTKKSGVITQVAISGGFSDKNVNDANLLTNPLDITIGSQTFTVPTGKFKNPKGKFTCSNVDTSNGIASATFDFNKCTFTLTIKNTSFTADSGTAVFKIEFGDFSEGAEVSLP